MTDEELVERVKGGEQRAFRLLVARYQSFVYTLIVRMVRDRQLAEDLAQETFLQMYRSLASFDARAKFSTWLYRIARNKVIDWSRSRAHKEQQGERELHDVFCTEDSVEDEVIRRDATRQLLQLMERLPDHYRAVLWMYYVHDLTGKEIAEQLHIPYRTVQTRIARGKKQLYKLWQEVNRHALRASMGTDVGC